MHQLVVQQQAPLPAPTQLQQKGIKAQNELVAKIAAQNL